MKKTTSPILGTTLAGVLALIVTSARADTFGSGSNAFTIDFVNVGNADNRNDSDFSDTLPDFSSPYGGVAYDFRMGTFEIPQGAITKAANLGLDNVTAGGWTGNRPATLITWYEAAAFVNWLNTSTGHHVAYDLTEHIQADSYGNVWTMSLWGIGNDWDNDPGPGVERNRYRHKDAYYFLPSEDEWYKAAFHKNDGVTNNYWDYATARNTIPTPVASGTTAGTAVFTGAFPQALQPANVNQAGGLSAYGTMGQSGNVWEWQESAFAHQNGFDDSPTENRVIRSGFWQDSENELRSSQRDGPIEPYIGIEILGFRVASVAQPVIDPDPPIFPEPSSALWGIGTGLMLLLRRRRGWTL